MTITLHLGVIDLPYVTEAPRRVVTKVRKGGPMRRSTAPAQGAETTGDVAGFLEARYHVMEIFFEEHKDDIAEAITQSMADALDNLIDRGVAPERIFPEEGLGDIQDAFVRFINLKEMNGILPGVPTAASVKRGTPSFVDTGLYRQSFRAWVDET